MNGMFIRIALIIIGVLLIVFGFWTHSIKKLAVNYAVIWGLLGVLMILLSAIPVLSGWTDRVASGTGIAFFCAGVLILLIQAQDSMVISQLHQKNRELAMQVAMLNQENERIQEELEEIAMKQGEIYAEKDSVCD